MRAASDAALPDTYQVRRTTTASDAAGGQTVTTAITSTGACRLRPGITPAEQVIADKLDVVAPVVVVLPVAAAVVVNDTLLINNRAFQVVGVIRGGAWAICMQAVSKEIL